MRSGSDMLYLNDANAMFRINVRKKARNIANIEYTANVEVADDALDECTSNLESHASSPSEKDSVGNLMRRKDCVSNFAAIYYTCNCNGYIMYYLLAMPCPPPGYVIFYIIRGKQFIVL